MKKSNSLRDRSKSERTLNNQSKPTRPKVVKRASTLHTASSQSHADKSKTVKKQQEQEVIHELKEEVIDLNKREDAEKLVAQLLAFLNISARESAGDEPKRFCTTSVNEVPKKTINHEVIHGDNCKFYTRLKQRTRSQEAVKLPAVETRRYRSSFFQIRYSQPTNYEVLQNKLQKLQPRPFSFAIFDDRGTAFSRMRARETLESRNESIKQTFHPRSRTFPYESKDSDGKTSRRSNKNGRYSVSFVDDICGQTINQLVLV